MIAVQLTLIDRFRSLLDHPDLRSHTSLTLADFGLTVVDRDHWNQIQETRLPLLGEGSLSKPGSSTYDSPIYDALLAESRERGVDLDF